jgi:diacylglycerol kinase (ATP)
LRTTAPGHAADIVREAVERSTSDAVDRQCIVACGGDGTVHEIVNALMSDSAPRCVLGLIPAGRCDDFASALGVPDDADDIARVLLAGHTRAVDLGRIGDRYFCSVATLGFDSSVARLVNDMRLPLTGTPAYVYAALRTLLRYRAPRMRLTLDETVVDEPVFLAATANTPTYGGRLHIVPAADPYDGVFDVCVVSETSRLRAVRLLLSVIRRRHGELHGVRMMRASSVTIESPDPLEIWADGECLGV